jgi:hypothetical protein
MPLTRSQPPAAAQAAVARKLEQFSSPEVANPSALGGSDPGELELSSPHQTYVLDLDALDDESPLAAARPTGWRYLLKQGDLAVASAETVETEQSEHRFALFNSGPFVAATDQTLAAAEDLPEVADEDVEARLLTVPGVALRALWLHGARTDLLLPLAPAPPGLAPGRAYAPAEVFELIADQAGAARAIVPDDDRGA